MVEHPSKTRTLELGRQMHALAAELYPICRSVTGPGVRQTLAHLAKLIPLETFEVPSGKKVFDWEVPREWTIRDAAGNLVWVGTVDGQGQSPEAGVFSRGTSAMNRLRAATEQAFQNSSLRMRESPEVQRRLHPA